MDSQTKAEAARPLRANARSNERLERELAHKFGNLLQVINGNLELLSARIGDEQLRGYLANARAAAQQLTEITRALGEGSNPS